MEVTIKNIAHIDKQQFRTSMQSLETYTNVLADARTDGAYATPETALHAPFDESLRKQAHEVARRFKGVRYVFLVGIGGSDMGVRAVYESLNAFNRTPACELIDFDTLEAGMIAQAETIIKHTQHAQEVVCIVVSKSGTTTETIANANILFDLLKNAYGKEQACAQTIVITGNDTPLHMQAKEYGMQTMLIPEHVGGRFSVFSNVGLVPLGLLGVDIDAFCEGAQKAIVASSAEQKPNTTAMLATLLFLSYETGTRVHELFFWNPELETLGKWYRQLLAESLGKKNASGTAVGFSPATAVGSVDLHSLGQLIFGGRNDRFTTFVSAPAAWQYKKTFSDTSPFMLSMLNGKTMEQTLRAIYKGVQRTYDTHNLPYFSMELSAINERELGAFMALHMTMVMYMAQLLQVNAFDQPAVETYKEEVRTLLTK